MKLVTFRALCYPLPLTYPQLPASEWWEGHVLSASVSLRAVCERKMTSAFALYPLNYLTRVDESV